SGSGDAGRVGDVQASSVAVRFVHLHQYVVASHGDGEHQQVPICLGERGELCQVHVGQQHVCLVVLGALERPHRSFLPGCQGCSVMVGSSVVSGSSGCVSAS